MFPTFSGKGDLVVAEALPTLLDRIQIGECLRWRQASQTQVPWQEEVQARALRCAAHPSLDSILASAQLCHVPACLPVLPACTASSASIRTRSWSQQQDAGAWQLSVPLRRPGAAALLHTSAAAASGLRQPWLHCCR
jgi:hypothetical protein